MSYRLKPLAIVLAAMLAAAALTSCGSDSPESPKPTIASRDGDGLTAEQREVADAVDKYMAATVAYSKGDDSVDLSQVATSEVVDLVQPSIDKQLKANRVMIGDYKLTPKSVSLADRKARYKGCSDFSKSFTVKKGETKPGVGSSKGSATEVDFGLVRVKEAWVVSDPKGTGESC